MNGLGIISLFSTNSTIESICLVFAVFFLSKDNKSRFWKITIAYMALVPSTELLGKYCAHTYHNNIWIYNIYSLFEAAFVLYGLHYFLKDYIKIQKLIIATFVLILSVFSIYTFVNGIRVYNNLMISMMSVFFIIYALLYFYLLLKDEAYVNLKFHPAFWWVGGVLIFYFGSTLANFFDDYFRITLYGKYTLRFFIYTTINIFLYGFWSYSFICRARQRKLSL